MKYSIVVILVTLVSFTGFAQEKDTYNLLGQVLDNTGAGLPYVAVGIFNVKDSSYVKGTATEPNGKFKVKVPAGNYYAKISFLSFKEKVVNNIVIDNKDVDLDKIKMVPSIKNLDEFEVVEEKKLMELDLDKRVFNVDKDVTNQGANAAEILDNVPSVSVDVDGNVSLRGSGNVRILINGKPSGLTGMTTSDAIKQLQGNQIEKIEIITNPSSRYDAEGEVGIINIILKQDKREGVNGSVNVDFGYPRNYGGGFSITLKKKNFNVFTGYGFSYRDSPGRFTSNQQFTYPDTNFSYSSESDIDRIELDQNFRLGTELYLNNYNSITLSGNYSITGGENKTDLIYQDFNQLDIATQTVTRDEDETKEKSSHDISLNYRKTFKLKDRIWTFDFQQSNSIDNEYSIIDQINDADANDNKRDTIYNNESGEDWLFQTDYVHPIGNGKLEFGLKHAMKEIVDDYQVKEFNDTINDWEIVPGFDNVLIYNENVSAGYLMFGNKVQKFSYQLGVRAEYTDVRMNLTATNEINNRYYFNLFPSTHFSYELKNDNSIQISYSRRIQRPRHWWLLPYFSYSDSRSSFSGNPNLNPEFTDSYELGHLKSWKKASLLSSIYYRYTINVMDWVIISDLEGITKRFPVNLGNKDAFGIEFSGNYELLKWWDIRGSFDFYREIRDGEFNGVGYDIDQYTWSTKLNSKWNIKKKINLQGSFNYRAPQKSPQGENKAQYSLDAGFSFDLLKGNGTVSFNAKDVFNTRKRSSTYVTENLVSESERQWRSRYFRISFTYRINQKKKKGDDKSFNDFEGGGEGG